MEITSPGSLWKEYDVQALPLNASELSEKTENGITVREFYFDGFNADDGKVRAFIKIYDRPDPKGVVLFMADSVGDDRDAIKKLYDFGYTVAALDYLGETSDSMRYTMYPQSLACCNRKNATEFVVDDETDNGYWFVWTYVARRAIKLLRSLYGETKMFGVGVGLGGSTIYKLCVFDDGLTACATLKNIIPNVTGSGNTFINYHASLDNSAYASLCKVPLFVGVASNAEDGSITDMSELAEATQSLGCFRIKERAFSAGVYSLLPEIDLFFDGKYSDLPMPEITPSNSDKNLYFNIDLNTINDESYKLDMFVTFCVENAPFRNWMNIPLISLGDNKYMAHINVCQNDKPIYAFVNITGKNGEVKSSAVLDVIPKTLGVGFKPGISHRKIYDGSMGLDCWTTRDGGTVSTIKGPFGIDGITCDSSSLVTFKPGDPLFKVPSDILLQLMLSGKPQTVTVSVHEKDASYSCYLDITDSDNWHKFSLSHTNFKGEDGTLSDWSNILVLEFSFEEPLIVGSVLWV